MAVELYGPCRVHLHALILFAFLPRPSFSTFASSLNSVMGETTRDASPSKSRAMFVARSGPHFGDGNRNEDSHSSGSRSS
ncbi:hypothetical protein BDP81DRAFT_136103 [Colletotrichum phormii]|uniref:Uncharacterized protein n=1 Tax=Colletotrichum phormii TaxID=359342 RepID=A0AAI9ZGU5_9PEZI|nr:uncharacterized protein BDP81DRAFT_136103 [Colletotrichum phormii]KAK1623196.1 hypothetical protein BDP81DRAFT_136103 [Colletotrichum phormii]